MNPAGSEEVRVSGTFGIVGSGPFCLESACGFEWKQQDLDGVPIEVLQAGRLRLSWSEIGRSATSHDVEDIAVVRGVLAVDVDLHLHRLDHGQFPCIRRVLTSQAA